MSSLSAGSGKPEKGPVTEMHEEYDFSSLRTWIASSYPVTIMTFMCGSRLTGQLARIAS